MDKVIITTFTDPMMGLSYECEPIFRKLETHFKDRIEFRYKMGGLVRSVYDLVDPRDLSKGKETAIKNYNVRLAKIYESEEAIMGMPINMTDFHLFSTGHTSSIPLNLAYKAVQLAENEKADLFLYNLRYATIVDCRPTTHLDEILEAVRKTNIDTEIFLNYYNNGMAQSELEKDLQMGYEMGIRSLPAYLIQYGGKAMLIQSLIGYNAFAEAIEKITDGEVKLQKVTQTTEALRKLINAHPLISPIEIREALDFDSIEEVREFVEPLLDSKEIEIEKVYHGWFIQKTEELK
ncbi:MAG: DsbA family protein [Clostridia bacterium]|nr:DsbA family protein [Clostridia bacterium]